MITVGLILVINHRTPNFVLRIARCTTNKLRVHWINQNKAPSNFILLYHCYFCRCEWEPGCCSTFETIIMEAYLYLSKSAYSVSLKKSFLFMFFYCLTLVANDLHHKNWSLKILDKTKLNLKLTIVTHFWSIHFRIFTRLLFFYQVR